MKNILYVMLLLSFSSFAQEVPDQKVKGVKVFIIDKNIDSSSLEKKYEVTREREKSTTLPSRDDREELLKGLTGIEKWDELQKDIFYMDLPKKSISDLMKKYPEIKKEDMKSLKERRK